MFKKRKANKKIQELLNDWYANGKKDSPAKHVGMTRDEFDAWLWERKIPERFLK